MPGWARCPLSTFPPQICPELKKQLGSPRLVHTQKYIIIRNCGSTAGLEVGRGPSGAVAGGRLLAWGLRSQIPRRAVQLALAAALRSAFLLSLPPLASASTECPPAFLRFISQVVQLRACSGLAHLLGSCLRCPVQPRHSGRLALC